MLWMPIPFEVKLVEKRKPTPLSRRNRNISSRLAPIEPLCPQRYRRAPSTSTTSRDRPSTHAPTPAPPPTEPHCRHRCRRAPSTTATSRDRPSTHAPTPAPLG